MQDVILNQYLDKQEVDTNSGSAVLTDINQQGKKVNWQKHKLLSIKLMESYTRLGFENKAARVYSCGTYLTFKVFEDLTTKLHNMISCQVRLCPMCSWRRTLKIFGQFSKVMNYLEDSDKYNFDYLFGTFSCKTVYAEDLPQIIDKLYQAFKRFTERKEFKKIVKGFFRALEITYDGNENITKEMWNGDKKKHIRPRANYYKKLGLKIGDPNPNFNKYHPHFHMIIAVNKSYFKESSLYLDQKGWAALWQSCLKVDYMPIFDIRRFKESEKGKGKEVSEAAKYSVKVSDLFYEMPDGVSENSSLGRQIRKYFDEKTDRVISVLDRCLAHRRLIAFGGIFKEVHKILNLDDPENGDLINTDNDEDIRDDLNYILVNWNWNPGIGNYVFDSVLTDNEMK